MTAYHPGEDLSPSSAEDIWDESGEVETAIQIEMEEDESSDYEGAQLADDEEYLESPEDLQELSGSDYEFDLGEELAEQSNPVTEFLDEEPYEDTD